MKLCLYNFRKRSDSWARPGPRTDIADVCYRGKRGLALDSGGLEECRGGRNKDERDAFAGTWLEMSARWLMSCSHVLDSCPNSRSALIDECTME